jgi:rod shape-determining protein MreC
VRLAGEFVFALLKQYRELVVTLFLVTFPFAVYLSHAKRGRDLNLFDRGIVAITGPVERGLMATVGAGQDAWGDYVSLRSVRAENLKLRREVLHLQEEALSLQEARLENERLRQMLDFSRSRTAPMVIAPVVGIGLAPTYLSLRIARGETDGIKKGMAVVTPSGAIGRVQEVASGYSDVLLLTDVNSAIAVETQKTRARATVRGGGEVKRCKLDFAERSALFEDGDLLITAGTDGVFPKGLAVGRVTHLDNRKSGWYASGEVEPAVDLATVEEVLVVTQLPPGREEKPGSALSISKAGGHP